MLVLGYLEKKLPELKDEWELIAMKEAATLDL